jgi:hypothetical protein
MNDELKAKDFVFSFRVHRSSFIVYIADSSNWRASRAMLRAARAAR